MRFIISILILTFLIVGCAEQTTNNQFSTKVTRVVDGDTVKVEFNNQEETIRLLLVDTPETVHPSKPEQPFGSDASQFAKDMLEGQEVRVELDVSERDKYGRLLAYVWINDKMFNEMLLERGLARVAYVYAPNVKYVDQFRDIQKKAQKEGIGIWSIENYTLEDGFNEEVLKEESQKLGQSSGDVQMSCDNPKIKGNINSKREKIYHVPDGQYYEKTIAEEMFCTEQEAENAGFRKSLR